MSGRYDDIISLPHHVSATRPRMPLEERAAQFAPFAALTGFEDVVRETARVTDHRPELSEERKAELDLLLRELRDLEEPSVTVTWYEPDGRKEGGRLLTVSGTLRRLDEGARLLLFTDGVEVAVDDIYEIEF